METKIIQISQSEFLDNLGAECILNCNGCLSSVSRGGVKYGEKKKNRLSDSVSFGRCARSRVGANINLYAEKNAHRKDLNLCFLTLTFPSVNDKDFIYRADYHDQIFTSCVQTYFKYLVVNKICVDYVWFSERHTNSEKHKTNNNSSVLGSHLGWLHFHCFVWLRGFQNIKALNALWHNVLQRSSVPFLRFSEKKDKNGHLIEFASVDSEWLQKKGKKLQLQKLINYVKKYVSKDCATSRFYARCWGWSRGLSRLCGKVRIKSESIADLIPFIGRCYRLEIWGTDCENKDIKQHSIFCATFKNTLWKNGNKQYFYNFFNFNEL